MRKETSEWTVRMLADFRGRINVDAEYQRGNVWSQAQQALLIDSILRGFDIPKIFLRNLGRDCRGLLVIHAKRDAEIVTKALGALTEPEGKRRIATACVDIHNHLRTP